MFFQRVKIDHGRRSTVRSGKTVRATHLVTMTFFLRLCDSFPLHIHVFTVRPLVRPWRSGIRLKNPFSGPPDPKMRIAPFEVAQSCLTQNTICLGMLADKKNAGPVAFYPTVGVWQGRTSTGCKPHSGKTKNASEFWSASKRPAIPLVSMVTSKKTRTPNA